MVPAGQHGGVTDVRTAPGERAGLRLLLGLLGALLLSVVLVPLSILVRGEYAPLVRFDVDTSRTAERAVASSEPLLRAAQATTLLGEPLLVTLAAAAMAAWLWWRGHRRLALFVLASRVGANVLSTGLKAIVDRARPVFDEPVATALGAAFPSGHALAAAAFWTTTAVVVAHWRGRLAVLLAVAIAIALVVCASRVLLGVHYPTDVLGGLLLGVGWTAVCTAVFTAWRRDERGSAEPGEIAS